MSEEEKRKEIEKLEQEFPANSPGWEFKFNRADEINLYIGRIISILDEFGETNDWSKYICYSVDETAKNYEKLVLRFVKEYKPELFSYYMECYGIDEKNEQYRTY